MISEFPRLNFTSILLLLEAVRKYLRLFLKNNLLKILIKF